ncbi:hypothetical protein BCAR13_1110015 [Paraburkholderia caribensis]|nr:hypothetical protein BCAR13_1110015 [Paraburkholderia caribensis]
MICFCGGVCVVIFGADGFGLLVFALASAHC